MQTKWNSISVRLSERQHAELSDTIRRRNSASEDCNQMTVTGVMKQLTMNWIIENRKNPNTPFPPNDKEISFHEI